MTKHHKTFLFKLHLFYSKTNNKSLTKSYRSATPRNHYTYSGTSGKSYTLQKSRFHTLDKVNIKSPSLLLCTLQNALALIASKQPIVKIVFNCDVKKER